jgi:hypothetical protein
MVVKLAVGAKPDIVHAHQGVLCKSSEFFKNAMKPELAGRREDPGTIDLSDDSLDEVKLYVQWLYSDTINIKTTEDSPSKERLHEAETHYTVLVKAFIYGEKVMDTAYTNQRRPRNAHSCSS